MNSSEEPIDSLLLFGVGGDEQPAELDTFYREKAPKTSYWVHCDVGNPQACQWLREKSGVDPLLVEPMLARKVRPRLVLQQDSVLIILRVADTLDMAAHEELRSLRIYFDGNRIISTSIYSLPVIREITGRWNVQSGEKANPVNLFMDLIIFSVRGLELILEDLEDQADTLESQVLEPGEDPEDRDIATLALDGLHLRRCLAPQKEVLTRLVAAEVSWLEVPQKKRIREIQERVSRQLDETEGIRERARIIREQRNSHVAEEVNKRLYVFSVVAVIFIPLGFFTGLLGVNLGGIPGAESPLGFFSFCALLLTLTLGMILAFRRFRWL